MQYVEISKLKTHPINKKIYGENEDIDDLIPLINFPEDIKPIIINPNFIIISGHRRYLAAKQKKFKRVPVEIKRFKSPDEENAFLIKENITRQTNNYQKIKSAVEFKRLIKEGVTQVTQDKIKKKKIIGRLDNYIAEIFKLGTYRSVHRAEIVLNKINELLKVKKNVQAYNLICLLNDNIVSAHNLVKEEKQSNKIIKIYSNELKNAKKRYPKANIKLSNIVGISLKKLELTNLEKEALKIDNEDKEFKLNKFWLKDSIEILKTFPDKCIDCVITDPPYGINLKHSVHINYEDSPEHFFDLLNKVCKEINRIIKSNSHLYFFFAITQYNEVRKILEKYFKVSEFPLIWKKTTFTKSKTAKYQAIDYLNANDYECIFYCRKGNRKLNHAFTTSILDIPSVSASRKVHSGEKPVALLEEFVQRSSVEGEVILDPFAGSGSTCLAAAIAKRWFIGIEKDPNIWKRSHFRNWKGSIQCEWGNKKKILIPYIKTKDYYANNLRNIANIIRQSKITVNFKKVDLFSEKRFDKVIYFDNDYYRLLEEYNLNIK